MKALCPHKYINTTHTQTNGPGGSQKAPMQTSGWELSALRPLTEQQSNISSGIVIDKQCTFLLHSLKQSVLFLFCCVSKGLFLLAADKW